jgi:hypothetical protein
MAGTFHPFPKLPAELRLKIWEQAMIEERPNRRIILYMSRVVPFKKMISPLLLVNFESRTCAKAFYNVNLDIYAVPPLSEDQVEVLDRQKQWARIPGIEDASNGEIQSYNDSWLESYTEELRSAPADESESESEFEYLGWSLELNDEGWPIDLKVHWSDFVRDKLPEFGSYSAAKAETSGPTTGAFYISPEHDVFIDGYECGMHFHIDKASEILGDDCSEIKGMACHHISAKLNPAIRKRVTTLVLLIPSLDTPRWHCVFAEYNEIDLDRHPLSDWTRHRDRWRQKTFPCVRAHFTLNNCSYGNTKFLETLTEGDDVELSRVIDEWVTKASFKNRKGNVVRKFEKKKRYGNGPGVEKPNWTRDLMAHWDISK